LRRARCRCRHYRIRLTLPAPADAIEPGEIDATAYSVQPDIDTRSMSKRVQAGPENYGPPRRQPSPVDRQDSSYSRSSVSVCPPLSRVFQPDKLTTCDKLGPRLTSLEACPLTFWLQKKEKNVNCWFWQTDFARSFRYGFR
jgi:hypothetical protein